MKTQVSQSIHDVEKKTSIRWLHEDDEFKNITIVEPDGWVDHEDFYNKEISKEEFIMRLAKSYFKEEKEKKTK